MSFKENTYQQLSLTDSFSVLTSREQKALENPGQRFMNRTSTATACLSVNILSGWMCRKKRLLWWQMVHTAASMSCRA